MFLFVILDINFYLNGYLVDLDYVVQDFNGVFNNFNGYDYIIWWVGNVKQVVFYYNLFFGFKIIVYKGFEIGFWYMVFYVVENVGVCFVFIFFICFVVYFFEDDFILDFDCVFFVEIYVYLERYGDVVKDVVFEVDNIDGVYVKVVVNGVDFV